MPAKITTRTRVSFPNKGDDDIETSYLTTTKAARANIVAAAEILGLSIVETRTIPSGTKLYGGRYTRNGDFCFSHYTRAELAAFLSDEALADIDATDEHTFDGDTVSACISLDGTTGGQPERRAGA